MDDREGSESHLYITPGPEISATTKIAVGKKVVCQEKKNLFPHSLCFPSPSYSRPPFSLLHTCIHIPPMPLRSPSFLPHPSISPSPLMSPLALPLCLCATPFWERTGLGPGCQLANKKWMNPVAVLLRQVGRKTGELSGRWRGWCEIC